MSDDFLTMGLQEDRYLKAIQLVDQFEREIEAILEGFDQRLVDEHPEFFDPSDDPSVRTNRTPGTGLVIHRINHSMNGPRAPVDSSTQKLNVHLYWMPPTEYSRTDIDGALRGFGYKVKNADQAVDTRVEEQTRADGWPVEMSDNPYDSNTVFYNHVSSTAEIEQTMETLVDHFAEFGNEYAAQPDEA